MQQRIIVVGAGFAGYMSALAARRLIVMSANQGTDAAAQIAVTIIAPEPTLVIRPRLYEANPASMKAPLGPVLDAAGVEFLQGTVEAIHTENHEVEYMDAKGHLSTVSYAKLILASGSHATRPSTVAGLQNAFFVDNIENATKLEKHLQSLANDAPDTVRGTVVVCGGGFTGVELAAELPGRLARILGRHTGFRVILVEAAGEIGPDLPPALRPVVTEALQELGVELRSGVSVVAVDTNGVVTAAGERIETATPIWVAGTVATPLTQQVPGARDRAGRLHVDSALRVPSAADCFATGDAACAVADREGHQTLQSCQHALPMGRYAGHNAAAELLGLPIVAYTQPDFKTCIDLGSRGAVFSEGWDGMVKLTGAMGDPVKRFINEQLIYPPEADAEAAFAAADPTYRYVLPKRFGGVSPLIEQQPKSL